jgi:hypothetical protein
MEADDARIDQVIGPIAEGRSHRLGETRGRLLERAEYEGGLPMGEAWSVSIVRARVDALCCCFRARANAVGRRARASDSGARR